MALIACHECGKQMSDEAVACPHCGAKPKKKTSLTTWIVGGLLLAFVLNVAWKANITPTPPSTPVATTAAQQAKSDKDLTDLGQRFRENKASGTGASTVSGPASSWLYIDDADEMTGKSTRTATVESVDKVTFDFPYGGPQPGFITIRSHPRHGQAVVLSFKKAHFNCSIVDDCFMTARFDDQPSARYRISRPTAGSTDLVFISDHGRFIRALKAAKRVRIEAEFYRSGIRTVEFYVAGLEWSSPAKTAAKKL